MISIECSIIFMKLSTNFTKTSQPWKHTFSINFKYKIHFYNAKLLVEDSWLIDTIQLLNATYKCSEKKKPQNW
jgi:hypothetical protein